MIILLLRGKLLPLFITAALVDHLISAALDAGDPSISAGLSRQVL
jgi:hypothetical protein